MSCGLQDSVPCLLCCLHFPYEFALKYLKKKKKKTQSYNQIMDY